MMDKIFKYSNWASVSSNVYEFNITFKRSIIDKDDEFDEGEVTIAMSPQHAKAVSVALLKNINNYEAANGKIVVATPESNNKSK